MGRVLWSRSAGWETLVGLLFVVTGQSKGERQGGYLKEAHFRPQYNSIPGLIKIRWSGLA